MQELAPWFELQKKYPGVSLFFYPDKGVNLATYIPQLRPHILKQHFAKYPILSTKTFFYHDSDIIFSHLPDFSSLVEGDICWQSNTSGYLDYNYLRKKEIEGKIPEDEAISILAGIGKVSVETIKSYSNNTGGAQYILKGIDSAFWEDVERQVLEIRNAFWWGTDISPNTSSVNYKYFTKPGNSAVQNENAGFQSWCADMWAVNFALWSRGKTTQITPELDFSWATDDWNTYLNKPIYHNAGVVGSRTGLFFKGSWINQSPIGKDIPLPPENSANRAYVLALKEVK